MQDNYNLKVKTFSYRCATNIMCVDCDICKTNLLFKQTYSILLFISDVPSIYKDVIFFLVNLPIRSVKVNVLDTPYID